MTLLKGRFGAAVPAASVYLKGNRILNPKEKPRVWCNAAPQKEQINYSAFEVRNYDAFGGILGETSFLGSAMP